MSDFIELLFVIAILAIVFGARRVARLGETLGRWMHGAAPHRRTGRGETGRGET